MRTFDTEKFVREVYSRECIWSGKTEESTHRSLRREAWEEIAMIMNEDYRTYGTKKQLQTIQLLQKKWKHLRDYFVRENNKEQNSKGAPKKPLSPLLDMLQFLQTSRGSRRSISRIRQAPRARSLETTMEASVDGNNCSNSKIDDVPIFKLEESEEQPSSAKTNEKDLTLFKECIQNAIAIQEQNSKNPHLNFFLSLLPEMQTMTDRQVFELKFEIMKYIQKIKYNNVH